MFTCKIGWHQMGVGPYMFCAHDIDHLIARGLDEPQAHCSEHCPIPPRTAEQPDPPQPTLHATTGGWHR